MGKPKRESFQLVLTMEASKLPRLREVVTEVDQLQSSCSEQTPGRDIDVTMAQLLETEKSKLRVCTHMCEHVRVCMCAL